MDWVRARIVETDMYSRNSRLPGLHESFEWCEEFDLEPVYAIWSGYYLDFEIMPQDQLQPYIDEALNSIEYITGYTSTYYGAMRAANGRKEPWKLNYVEFGNEDTVWYTWSVSQLAIWVDRARERT